MKSILFFLLGLLSLSASAHASSCGSFGEQVYKLQKMAAKCAVAKGSTTSFVGTSSSGGATVQTLEGVLLINVHMASALAEASLNAIGQCDEASGQLVLLHLDVKTRTQSIGSGGQIRDAEDCSI